MIKRFVAIAVLLVGLLVSVAVASTSAAAQDDEPEPAPTATADAEAASPDDGSISNTGVLLFGSVLLAGGIWAYQNREKRGYRY